MKKEEKEAKALEKEQNNQLENNVVSKKNEDEIISDEDAEKLEGGIGADQIEEARPSEGCLGGLICCNG